MEELEYDYTLFADDDEGGNDAGGDDAGGDDAGGGEESSE